MSQGPKTPERKCSPGVGQKLIERQILPLSLTGGVEANLLKPPEYSLRSRCLQVLGIVSIAGASLIPLAAFFDRKSALAEGLKFSNPAPQKSLEVKESMPSQNLTPKDVREILQLNPNQIEFYFQGDHYLWDVNNASWGIYPPNDPNRGIGTIRVAKNDDFTNITSFQPLGSLYDEELQQGPGVAIAVGGMAVNTQLDKYYLDTATSNNDGNWVPSFELGSGIKTPDSYTGRMRVKKGLPKGGRYGRPGLVILGSDVNGNYARITYDDCVIAEENGTYEIRLDSQGNFASDTFTKLPPPLLQNKAFIPSVQKNGN